MKMFLLMILWIFAPVLTPYGLQVGEVKINNKTVKIMKKIILSPEWLQAAGNKLSVEVITMRFDGIAYVRFAEGSNCIAKYTKDGVDQSMQIQTFDTTIDADAGTDIIFEGTITGIIGTAKNGEFEKLSSISFYKCKSFTNFELAVEGSLPLTRLDFTGAPNLSEIEDNGNLRNVTYLDISECVQLTNSWSIRYMRTLTEIRAIAVHSGLAVDIAKAIESAISTDGVVYLRRGDEYNQTIIDAALNKGWDWQYAD